MKSRTGASHRNYRDSSKGATMLSSESSLAVKLVEEIWRRRVSNGKKRGDGNGRMMEIGGGVYCGGGEE